MASKRRKITKRKAVSKKGRLPKAAGNPIERPTPEMEARVEYTLGQVIADNGQVLALAYRRKPLIESLHEKIGLSDLQISALRYYRQSFDRTERSLTRCALSPDTLFRAGHSEFTYAEHQTLARRCVKVCEAALGQTLTTMRSVVLEDKSFSQVAMERFGSRLKEDSNGKVAVVPKSGRHRALIRQEFLTGLDLLSSRLKGWIYDERQTLSIWVRANRDGTAVIEKGPSAPLGAYGFSGSVVTVLAVYGRLYGEARADLTYKTNDQAVEALTRTAQPLLNQLLDEDAKIGVEASGLELGIAEVQRATEINP